MSLKDRITEDMKAAMRAKEADKLLTIRMLLAAVKQKEVDERVVVDDTMLIAIVDKLIKQRKDSISQFGAAGRQDLVDKESAELLILEAYLPARLSADEITAAVNAIVADLGAKGPISLDPADCIFWNSFVNDHHSCKRKRAVRRGSAPLQAHHRKAGLAHRAARPRVLREAHG